MTSQRTILIVLGACAIVTGCSVLSPQPDRSSFYILTPVPETNSVTTAPNPRLTVGLGPVEFPDYLRRLPVVTRVEPHRVELSDDKRWAEPLDKNFTRVLSENLETLLDTEQIERYPWPLATKVDYQIEVDVQRFEAVSGGRSQLVATWMIRDGQGHNILYASRTVADSPTGADQAGASSALSSDLATLSKEIAAHVSELDRRRVTGNSVANPASQL